MKIMTVVGARPQFIKEAMVSHELIKNHEEVLVHTGQHFDYNMSEEFFEELDIPHPAYNLGISGGNHGSMTGRMLEALECVMKKEKPDVVCVFGDTNSTLAASLAAVKLHMPVAHVEAGGRSYCLDNPEEVNRICTDHVSKLLLAATEKAMEFLAREGLRNRSVLVGNTMFDAFVAYSPKAENISHTLTLLAGGKADIPKEYYYLTCHRQENTQDEENLRQIFLAMEQLDAPTVYPVHPRNKERAARILEKEGYRNTLLVEPVGYLTSIFLVNHAKKIVTDSGGLQTEAFFARKKCVVVLDFDTWLEIRVGNRVQDAKADARDILDKLETPQIIDEDYQPFGDGHAAAKIVMEMEKDGWRG